MKAVWKLKEPAKYSLYCCKWTWHFRQSGNTDSKTTWTKSIKNTWKCSLPDHSPTNRCIGDHSLHNQRIRLISIDVLVQIYRIYGALAIVGRQSHISRVESVISHLWSKCPRSWRLKSTSTTQRKYMKSPAETSSFLAWRMRLMAEWIFALWGVTVAQQHSRFPWKQSEDPPLSHSCAPLEVEKRNFVQNIFSRIPLTSTSPHP